MIMRLSRLAGAALAFSATLLGLSVNHRAEAADLAEPVPAVAASPYFSVTEAQFLMGRLKNPFTGTNSWTPIVTIQHFSTNPLGDLYFFIDFENDGGKDGYQDRDAYGEFYAYFSSAKILGLTYGGPVRDIGLTAGVNAGVESHFRAYVPGAYVDWNVPGFLAFRTLFTAYIDDSSGRFGKAGKTDNSWQATLVWAYPFEIGNQLFSFEGFAEYTPRSRNYTYGTKLHDWILAEPQLRWDAGNAIWGEKGRFYLGTEYHYWRNKLGTKADESRFQGLAVVRF
jgi:hypothetical protein